ncbi:MAG: hypothetical protein NT027_05295 [Proteobacteria bacterium]|nr:hypothetical protein [Pseudomonadota bacterium]
MTFKDFKNSRAIQPLIWLGSKFGKVAKWLLVLIIVFVGFIAIGSHILNKWLSTGDGKNLLTSMIQEQTGGIASIESFSGNLPRGFKLVGFSLRLPDKNLKGHEAKPSINVKEIRMHLSMLSLCYGTIKIKEMLVDGLSIDARRDDGVLWIEGLQRFRTFGKAPEPEIIEPQTAKDEFSMGMIEKIVAAVLIPVRIRVANVGIKDLNLSLVDNIKGKEVLRASIGPLRAILGFQAWMRHTMLTVDFSGDGHQEGRKDGIRVALFQDQKSKINENFEFETKMSVEDLRHVRIASKTRHLPENLNFVLFEIGNILTNSLSGTIKLRDGKFDVIDFDLGINAKLNLDQAAKYAKNFDVGVKGKAELTKLSINGPLVTRTLQDIAKIQVPQIELAMKMDHVSIDHSLGVVDELNQSLKLVAKQNATGGIDILDDLTLKIDSALVNDNRKSINPSAKRKSEGPLLAIQNVSVSQHGDIVSVTNMKQVSIRAISGDLSIQEISVKAKDGVFLKTPILAKMELNSENFLRKLALRASVEMGRLLTGGIDVKTEREFGDVQVVATTRIPLVEKLVAFILPVLGESASKLPVIEKGKYDFDLKLNAKVPGGPLSTLKDRALKATGDVELMSHLQGLNVKHLESEAVIRNLSNLTKIKGAIEEQSFTSQLKMDSIEAKALPKALVNNVFNISLKLQNLSKLIIDDISALLPSVGTKFKADAEVEIGVDKMPRNVKFHSKTEISPKNILAGVSSIEATGDAVATFDLSSADLNIVDVSGGLELNQFSLIVPQKDAKPHDVALVEVRNMNGSLPFRQRLDVSELKKLAAKNEPTTPVSTNDSHDASQSSAANDSENKAGKAAETRGAPDKSDEKDGSNQVLANATVTESQTNAVVKSSTSDATIQSANGPDKLNHEEKDLDSKLSDFLEKYRESKIIGNSRMKAESYSEVRPNMNRALPVTAEKISFKDIAIENLELDAELSQNIIAVNQVVFNLLGGKIQSSVQISFDTKLRQIRVSGQATELDTRRLADSFPKLKNKMQSFSLLGSSPYIDGTIRLVYDAPSGDIAGGLEVTRIGKEQLKAMLLYVDPEEANPTIGTMRKALSLGEVRQVSVPIRNGQIGLDLDVRLLSAPIPTPKLHRFPLAQLVRNFTGTKSNDEKTAE